MAGVVPVPAAAAPGALSRAGAQEALGTGQPALGTGHQALASAPAALRRAVQSDLGAGVPPQLTTMFSSSRARLSTPSGTWVVGLGSIGRAGALAAVPATKPSYQGHEAIFRRSGLTEWFKQRGRGTEQGFTITHRPAGLGPLVVALSVPGLSTGYGSHGSLVLRQGQRAVLGYSDLTVRDATGSAVPARLVPDGPALRIVVDDAQAVYPLYIDPIWSPQQERPRPTVRPTTASATPSPSPVLPPSSALMTTKSVRAHPRGPSTFSPTRVGRGPSSKSSPLPTAP